MMTNGYYHEVRKDGKARVTINAHWGEYSLVYEESYNGGWKKTYEDFDTEAEAMERAKWYMRRS